MTEQQASELIHIGRAMVYCLVFLCIAQVWRLRR